MNDPEKQTKTVECPLCHERHDVMTMHGITYVPCPQIPRDLLMPVSTLEAFMGGQSMLDDSFIIIR